MREESDGGKRDAAAAAERLIHRSGVATEADQTWG
jgi:hypothetical protein